MTFKVGDKWMASKFEPVYEPVTPPKASLTAWTDAEIGQFGDEATSDFEKDVALILRNTVGKGLKAPPYASFHITNSHVILYWFEVEVERSRSFKVMIIQDDGSLRDSGEGPWSTWQQADDFARAEVGMNYTIEEC
jgi:hypothetical protein